MGRIQKSLRTIWSSVARLAALITLVTGVDILLRDRGWGAYAQRLYDPWDEQIAELISTAWAWVVVASLLITSTMLARFILVKLAIGGQRAYLICGFIWRRWKMAEKISNVDALHLVKASDFFQSRLPSSRESEDSGDIGSVLTSFRNSMKSSGMLGSGVSRRDRMVREQYARDLLRAFENYCPDGKDDAGYDRLLLEEWLEKLFSAEVRKEMGDIPEV